jgi:hypothetical protein
MTEQGRGPVRVVSLAALILVERLGPRGVYAIGAVAGLVYGLILLIFLRSGARHPHLEEA